MKRRAGGFKYVVSKKRRKYLIVDASEHALVKAFAVTEGITSIEATHYLLGLAFAQIHQLPKKKPWWKF